MKTYDVYGIGNALVDTEYEVDDHFLEVAKLPKGMMTLIDASDRQRLIRLLEEEHEHEVIKQAGGGSAANTMVAISQFGGKVFYSCKVANDETGDFFMSDLKEAGVTTNLDNGRTAGITGKCISMVTPDAERTMTTHLGITEDLSIRELDESALADSSYLYIEGYLVSSTTGFEAAKRAQEVARGAGAIISLTLSDPAMVDNFKSNFDELASRGVDLIFCNEEEAFLWTGTDNRDDAMEGLRSLCPYVAMTCGKEGAMVHDGKQTQLVPGVPATAVDTTGAGDIFAGAFLYCINNGKNYEEAAAFANRAASTLVSSYGARLTMDVINEKILLK